MALTVTEKDHFRNRLRDKVAQIKAALEAENVAWRKEVREHAVAQLERQYGIQDQLAELQELRAAAARAGEKVRAAEEALVATMRGLAPEDVKITQRTARPYSLNSADYFARYPHPASGWMNAHCEQLVKALTRSHPVGAKLADLEELHFEIQDEIAAAGTHKQIAEVWERAKLKFDLVDEGGKRRSRKIDTTRAASKKTSKAATKGS